jgi:uncharacterized protein
VTKDRIVLLDSLRGLAILGILLCNIPVSAMPERVAESVPLWPLGQSAATVTVWYVTQALFQQKFYTLFSMLFGASILLVAGEGPLLNPTLIKRLLSLLIIGLLHGFLIWQGDVLSFYALVGLVAMLVRGWPAKRLLTAGIGVHLGVYAWRAFKTLQHAPKSLLPMPPDIKAKVLVEVQTETARFSGDFMSSLLANAHGYKEFFVGSWQWPPIWPLMVLSLMLMGMGLFKLGVLKGEASTRTYQALIATGLGALVIVAFLLAVYLATGASVGLLGGVARTLQGFTAPVATLGYVGLMALAARSRLWTAIPAILAPAGQMAFTNYLMQSVIMTVIFYGGRGPALYGKLDRPALAMIVLAIWVAQLLWSRWWMARFAMGPLEWVWRLAYRGVVPLRRPQ